MLREVAGLVPIGLWRGNKRLTLNRDTGSTNGVEGVAQLQVEGSDWNLVAHRQHGHCGQVTGRVGDISRGRHRGEAEGGAWWRVRGQ